MFKVSFKCNSCNFLLPSSAIFIPISDCQWIPWEGKSIRCSREDFHFFSTPDYIICFTFRPTNVSVATSNRNSSPNQNDLNRSGDQQKSHDQSERSHGLTGMKGLSVIFYLDDYGFYTTDLPALHYKSSTAKGKIDTIIINRNCPFVIVTNWDV